MRIIEENEQKDKEITSKVRILLIIIFRTTD